MRDYITKREILFSLVIVAIFLIFGFMISEKIDDSLMNKYQEYNTALHIEDDKSMFQYAMKTNIGNSFVHGDLKAIDTVSYPEIDGEYSYIKKIKERYTKHHRTVTKTRTVNGKTETYTEIEEYWTWDSVESWSQHSEIISFLNVEFPYGTIEFPDYGYITTIRESSNIRYVYYGNPVLCIGTLYANLHDNTITNTRFFNNKSIEQTIEYLESGIGLIAFWIGWIILIVIILWVFFYIDNKWLEN